MSEFGTKLREYRKAKKITLRELGVAVKKKISYIHDIESGRKQPPKLDMVEKIENYLGVERCELIVLARKERKGTKSELINKIAGLKREVERLKGNSREKCLTCVNQPGCFENCTYEPRPILTREEYEKFFGCMAEQ